MIFFADGIQKFDYGNAAENLKHYNSLSPPKYELEKITCPIAIMWSENDVICTPEVWIFYLNR